MCWLIFLIDDIVENINLSHGFDKEWRHDQTCSSLTIPSMCLSQYAFPGMEYKKNKKNKKNIAWFHISNYAQVGEKTILHF